MFASAARLFPWFSAAAIAVAAWLTTAAADTIPSGPSDVEFTIRVLPLVTDSGEAAPVTRSQLDRTKRVVLNRLRSHTSDKPAVAIRNPDLIIVTIPALTQKQSDDIRRSLASSKLELREVNPRTDEVLNGKSLAQRVKDGSEIVPGYRVNTYKHKDVDGKIVETPILIHRRVALGGSDIAQAIPSPLHPDAVSIRLNEEGTAKMIALTTPMQPGRDRIAIVLDGVVLSAPVVRSVPLGKDFIIEGLTEPGEVRNLADALMNPLENAIEVTGIRTVSQSLQK